MVNGRAGPVALAATPCLWERERGVSAVEIVILEENCEVRFILTHGETRACARQMETDTMRIKKKKVVLWE